MDSGRAIRIVRRSYVESTTQSRTRTRIDTTRDGVELPAPGSLLILGPYKHEVNHNVLVKCISVDVLQGD